MKTLCSSLQIIAMNRIVCAVLFSVLAFSGCEGSDTNESRPIRLTGNTQSTLNLYADDIRFYALEPRTATVAELSRNTAWMRLNRYAGDPGDWALDIALDANSTKADRSAEILPAKVHP